MCKKVKFCNSRIDKCIKPLIIYLKSIGIKPVASCCGHGVYPLTLIMVLFLNYSVVRSYQEKEDFIN